jgi:hypothetical protein
VWNIPYLSPFALVACSGTTFPFLFQHCNLLFIFLSSRLTDGHDQDWIPASLAGAAHLTVPLFTRVGRGAIWCAEHLYRGDYLLESFKPPLINPNSGYDAC